MNRFVTWARFGNKSKEQLQQPNVQPHTTPPLPEGGQEKEMAEEAADPSPCRDSLDHRSADVEQPDDTPQSNGEDMVTPKAGAVIQLYVAVPYSHNPITAIVIPAYDRHTKFLPLILSNFFASDADLSLRLPGRRLSCPSTP
jgi:hypothetical protein